MDVQELIATAEPPTMRVDVQAAVLAGRRAQRRRHVMLAAAGVVVVVGLTAFLVRPTPDGGGGFVAAPAVCTTAPFDRENGGMVVTSDPTGTYVIGSDGQRPMLWGPSGRVVIEIAPNSYPIGVNSSGVVVGSTDTSAWKYHNGLVEPLTPLAGYERSSATGINRNGDIAGTAATADGRSVAVIWPGGTGTPRPLQADFPSVATGIADDGTVIGKIYPRVAGSAPSPEPQQPLEPGDGQAYAWAPDGTGRVLEAPSGWASAYPGAVHDGRALGFAFQAQATDTPKAPVVWDLRTGKATVPSPFTGQPTGTTTSGWITFGTTVISAETGQAREISKPEGNDDQSVWPVWVSRDGRTVIGNATISGRMAATVWTCD